MRKMVAIPNGSGSVSRAPFFPATKATERPHVKVRHTPVLLEQQQAGCHSPEVKMIVADKRRPRGDDACRYPHREAFQGLASSTPCHSPY